jgi:ribosomal protein L22
MEKETTINKEKKEETKTEKKMEEKNEIKKEETTTTKETTEQKTEEKKEEKKTTKKELPTTKPKEKAIAKGTSIRISLKYASATLKIIKGKTPEQAIRILKEVLEEKRPVPMRGREVAHQKGKGIAGAKYPKNVCKELIPIVEQGRANALQAGIEEPIITIAKANKATRPMRRGGRQGKRTHIELELKNKTIKENKG